MTLLDATGICRSLADRVLLDNVSLHLGDGDRVGLIGPNGCGKSTLLRILAGVETADDGKVVKRRDLRVGFLPQEPVVDPEATIRQAVRAGLGGRDEVLDRLNQVHGELAEPCLPDTAVNGLLAQQARLEDELESMGGYDVEHRVESTIAHLGLPDPEALCGRLSGGERRRVALARLLLSGPDLLLLDEPTNHLDAEVTLWLEGLLAELPCGLIMVTHDRYLLDRVVDRIVEVDRGLLHEYKGSYGDYLVARSERLAGERQVEQARRNLLQRETAWMVRGPPARTGKAKARIQRHGALVDAAPTLLPEELELVLPPGPRLGARVITLQGVAFSRGDKAILPTFDLEIGAGERLGILGPNGAGKSTLLDLVLGKLQPDTGTVTIGGTVNFASIDQSREDLDPNATVAEEVAGAASYVTVAEQTLHIESFLDRFLFPGQTKHRPVRELSGGERNRVLLAKLLLKGGNVLVLDEPTNDLDLPTLRALEESLVAFPGTVLVVSHDRWFLDRVATLVAHLDGKGGLTFDACSASELLERVVKRGAGNKAGSASEGSRSAKGRKTNGGGSSAAGAGNAGKGNQGSDRESSSSDAATNSTGASRLTHWELTELESLPDKIETAEADLVALDEQLADPKLYRGPKAEAQRLQTAREKLATEVATLSDRWEDLETRHSETGGR